MKEPENPCCRWLQASIADRVLQLGIQIVSAARLAGSGAPMLNEFSVTTMPTGELRTIEFMNTFVPMRVWLGVT